MTTADEILAGEFLYADAPTIDVTDAENADRVGRAIRANEAEVAQRVALVEAQSARLVEWLDEQTAPILKRIEYLRDTLDRYMRAERERLGDRCPRTIHLPSGDLELRKVPLSIDVLDASAAVEALEEDGYDQCVNYPPAPAPKPVLAEVKKLCERKQRPDGSYGVAYFIPNPDEDAAVLLADDIPADAYVEGDGGRWWFIPGLDASPPGERVTFKPNVAPEEGGGDWTT